ncbi:MAG: DUF370 domain-containing protein [Eubacteriales bacterium]|nr:DUF370 domain-containing protein [Eubacteriales bacterium]MDD4421493.1 DUF370 domain-containing protein [Eubacteriales bacterium]HBR32294.1 DUF370 domain-containing protein [Clostridiales bacterium]
MFLHLGKNESVSEKEIVGIFDIETASFSADTRVFFAKLQEEKRVVNLCDDLPKSFILVENELYESIYISQISAESLKKRAENNREILDKTPERNV